MTALLAIRIVAILVVGALIIAALRSGSVPDDNTEQWRRSEKWRDKIP